MIQIKELDFSYKKTSIFHSFNLDLYSEITVIMGENGVGKTTLFKLIVGALKQTKGTIKTKIDLSKAFSCLNEEGIYQNLTVKENIIFLRKLEGGKGWRQLTAGENLWVERFKMEKYLNQLVKNLSTGLKKRAQFVTGLSRNPSLILLDEPTNGIDYETLQLLKKEINQLSNKKVPILVITHDLKFCYEMADRILFMEDGKVMIDEKASHYSNLDEFEKNYASRMLKVKKNLA
ncbi:MAG: ABC transporter ATP-binding protein [Streptococcaceae bacterium]|jgi:ABC-type multidrug transport system ATPase subunit|nr:ABC transporter ATP-binding protein [Streptococcaceae bacterium]